MGERSLVALTWALLVVLYLGVGTFDHDVWSPVEPTVAGIVWSMSERGDLAVPRLDAEHPFLDTPPLYYWLVLASESLSGDLSPGAIRLPAVLLGLACLASVFWIARRAWGARVACVAALFAGTTGMFWDLAHRAGTDVAGTAFAFFAFAAFARSFDAESERAQRGWDVLVALVLAASFYAKNLFTVFVALPPIALFLLNRGEIARLSRLLALGGGLGVAFALPWGAALYDAGGWEYARVALVDNTIGRLLPLESALPADVDPINDAWIAEKEPGDFYLWRVLAYPLPWTPLVLIALLRLWQRPVRRTDLQGFLLLGFVAVPLVLSLSSAKSTDYLAPILFFSFLLVADLLAEWWEAPELLRRWQRVAVWWSFVLVGVVLVLAPVALAAVLGSAWLALLSLAPVALALRLRAPRRVGGAWLERYALGAAASFALFLAFGIPALDEAKSFRPFFASLERDVDGRAVMTTFRDAYRLPLANYYLDRRLPYVTTDDVVDVLTLPVPVGVLMNPDQYEEIRPRLGAVPGAFVRDAGGGDRFRFVANRPVK